MQGVSCLLRHMRRGLDRPSAAGQPGRRRPRGRFGFTLLELLAVIAVVALLAAMLLPILTSARERARQTTCLSNLRQIAQAQLLYLQDWDERFPHWFFPAPARPAPLGEYVYWTEYFRPYLRSPEILHDPGDFWIWDLPREEKLAEYALGTWGRTGKGTLQNPYWQWPGYRQWPGPPLSLAEVRRSAETITVMDGWTTPGWTGVDLRRHHGGMDAAFVDGHARWLTEGEFWREDTDGHGVYWMHYAAADR